MMSSKISLIYIAHTIIYNIASGQYPNETCASWCKTVPDSSSCGNACSEEDCVIIPDSICGPGNWSWANNDINGDWVVSRSTHYGGTSGGACAYGNIPNCYGDNCQGTVPDQITHSAMAGNYAAPQGDFFAQAAYLNGTAAQFDYLSCGSCFEVKCKGIDANCADGVDGPITLFLADTCPCYVNVKWCCGNYSHCDEMNADVNGNAHCAVSQNGTWQEESLHLDLSDNAFGLLTTGKRGDCNPCGIINTMMRRVNCPVIGNVYIVFDESSVYQDQCPTIYGQPDQPCFYYLAVNTYNIGAYGGTSDVSIYGGFMVNGTLIHEERTLLRNLNYPLDKPQEQYGNWVNEQNVAIYMPLKFRIYDTVGRMVESPIYANFSSGIPHFLDIGMQFENVSFKNPPSIYKRKKTVPWRT
eukprot:536284_1